jgi:hypothetical protein
MPTLPPPPVVVGGERCRSQLTDIHCNIRVKIIQRRYWQIADITRIFYSHQNSHRHLLLTRDLPSSHFSWIPGRRLDIQRTARLRMKHHVVYTGLAYGPLDPGGRGRVQLENHPSPHYITIPSMRDHHSPTNIPRISS